MCTDCPAPDVSLTSLAVCLSVTLAIVEPAHADEPCKPAGARVGAVARVLDGHTLVMDDGTTVRLLSVMAPMPEDADADAAIWAPAQQAKAALEGLAGGRAVALAGMRAPDRYGRRPAHVMVTDGPEPVWVQQALVRQGYARTAPAVDGDPCAGPLVSAETAAREQEAGLWSHPAYRILDADRPADLLRRRGTFQVVRGTIAGVAEVRGQTYLNFGTDWRQDFTAGLSTTLRRRLFATTIDVSRLAGRTVEVRGWIERRNGPYITLHQPEDLRIVTDDAVATDGAAP